MPKSRAITAFVSWLAAMVFLWPCAYELLLKVYLVGDVPKFPYTSMREEHQATALVATIFVALAAVVWSLLLRGLKRKSWTTCILWAFFGTQITLSIYAISQWYLAPSAIYPSLFFVDVEFLVIVFEVAPLFAMCVAAFAVIAKWIATYHRTTEGKLL